MPDHGFSRKLYRRLLHLYPAAFRDEYAAPMEREFLDELAEAHSGYAIASLWVRLLTDLAISIPAQITREICQDARHTLRLWSQHRWYTGFAIVALAIGIGANTGVFSVINALLLRSLPFEDASRLASLQTYLVPHDSAKQFHDWRQHSAYLSDAALFEEADFNLGNNQNLLRAHIAQTSWNFFSLLGTHPAIGRAFRPGEDQAGRNAIAVISYGLWRQLFAGDPRALGSIIRVNGMPLTVIGVAPLGFEYPAKTLLWKAAQFSPGNNGWQTVGRLKRGITWPQARAAFTAEMERLSPHQGRIRHRAHPPKIIPLQDQLAGPVKQASLLLMAAVALILLIACANVANLLLARTADRSTEIAIRSALGASRARIIQQLLTECLLLSLASTIAGLAVARWTTTLAARISPAPLNSQSYAILDSRVLIFAIALSLLCALLFGVLPSMNAGRTHVFGARGSVGMPHSRLIRDLLVAAQVTLTIILLTASISVTRAFVHLMATDRGFATKGLITVSVSLDGTTHQAAARHLPYFEDVLARLRQLPGVRSASATDVLPTNATNFTGGPFGLDGRLPKTNAMAVPVLADYFQTMGDEILDGRGFSAAEVRSDAKVAVVSESFARQFGSPSDAVGHLVTNTDHIPRKIIGVAKGMDYMSANVNATQVFLPAHTPASFFFSTFVVRMAGATQDQVAMVRDAIRAVDPTVPVFGASTMQQRLDTALSRPHFYRTALLFFAGFALLLSVIGIFGVVSYVVSQRTREMGIRLALGATPTRLRGIQLKQELLTVISGAFCGIVGAAFVGRLLQNLVQGAKATSIPALLSALLFICLIAAISIWAATRRIARLDVAEILRVE